MAELEWALKEGELKTDVVTKRCMEQLALVTFLGVAEGTLWLNRLSIFER